MDAENRLHDGQRAMSRIDRRVVWMRGQILTVRSLSLAVLACGEDSRHGHLPDAPAPEDAAIDSSSTFTLTVTRNGNGAGTVTSRQAGVSCGDECSAAYESGTTVTLTAMASAGATSDADFSLNQRVTLTAVAGPSAVFTGWSGGGCTGSGTCMLTMNVARTTTASFTTIK